MSKKLHTQGASAIAGEVGPANTSAVSTLSQHLSDFHLTPPQVFLSLGLFRWKKSYGDEQHGKEAGILDVIHGGRQAGIGVCSCQEQTSPEPLTFL